MGWAEGVVGVAILMVIGGIFRFFNARIDDLAEDFNGKITRLDQEKADLSLCDRIQEERAGAIREVKEILNKQADCLVAIQAHLANIDGRLSAHGQNLNPAPPSDLVEP